LRPHIVIFNPDQWRGDVLGHVGNAGAVTPNLDALVVRDGVSFAQTFCQNTVSTPSRCAFMTGWYPHVRGHRTMYHMLQPDEPMLLRRLKEAGYTVFWGGKNDVVPAQLGYSPYCDVKFVPPSDAKPLWDPGDESTWRGMPGSPHYYSFYRGALPADESGRYFDTDWATVEGAIDWLHHEWDGRTPFCLYLALVYPHPPYAVEDDWFQLINPERLPARILPPPDWRGKSLMLQRIAERQGLDRLTEQDWTRLRRTYYAMCARVDAQFGLVLDALRERGVYDDTAVFFFSDHGDFTGDFGVVEKAQNCMEEPLVRVPLIVKPPRGVPMSPGVRTALVELIDVVPTIEEWAGLQPTYRHFGRSLAPLVADAQAPHRDAVFCEGGRLAGEREAMELESAAAREAPPTDSLYWPRLSVQYEDSPAHLKAVMCRTTTHKYVYRLGGQDELYALVSDPNEVDNRIGDPALEPIRTALRDRLLRFLVETGDVVPWHPDRRE
jgi:arylsulfatase A-like enzyme